MELLHGKLESSSWINLGLRLDRNLFNIRRHHATTVVVCWSSLFPEDQQTILAAAVKTYSRLCLSVNICNYTSFNHKKLGSILSEDSDVNHKIHNRIKQTFAAFGNFRQKVYQNNHLHTKVGWRETALATTHFAQREVSAVR